MNIKVHSEIERDVDVILMNSSEILSKHLLQAKKSIELDISTESKEMVLQFRTIKAKSVLGRMIETFVTNLLMFVYLCLSNDELNPSDIELDVLDTVIYLKEDTARNLSISYKEVKATPNVTFNIGVVDDGREDEYQYCIDAQALNEQFFSWKKNSLIIISPGLVILIAGIILCLKNFIVGAISVGIVFFLCCVAVYSFLKKTDSYKNDVLSAWGYIKNKI